MDKVLELIAKEEKRQRETLMMIPSENYTYPEVREAVGSVLMHKYAEGYPGKRYYQGCEFVDQIENLAIERAKKLFNVPFANVQALSGSPANHAVYFTLLNPGDKIMGLALYDGGHLTHGHPKVSFSGRYYQNCQYKVNEKGFLDYDEIEKIALLEKPNIIVCGFTSYPREIDFKRFAEIAEKVGAWLLADISHIVGLVVGGVHSSPVQYADVITTTSHKTLRGPRGALILVTEKGLKKDPDLGNRINKAVFPGMQGGPHLNNIAGIAIALEKASQPEFREYAKQVVLNAKVLAESLKDLNPVTGGTDNHMLLFDLRKLGIGGKEAAERLEASGIIVNKNFIPNDPNPPSNPSGIRLGTQAITVRGMKEEEMKIIGEMIKSVLIKKKNVIMEVENICDRFPLSFPCHSCSEVPPLWREKGESI